MASPITTSQIAAFRSGINVETLTGGKTLKTSDKFQQRLDPGGASRTIVLTAENKSKRIRFNIFNAADADEVLTINDDGGTTITKIGKGQLVELSCDGTSWYDQGSVRFGINNETLAGTKTLTEADSHNQRLDPGGADRIVILPAEAVSTDASFDIFNAADADETITINDDGGSTIAVITEGQSVELACDGTTWFSGGIEVGSTRRFKTWEYFDDFNQKVIDETNGQWILNSGSDAEAVDPVIATGEQGAMNMVSGDADGTFANDGSQIILAIPVQADSGGLIIRARLKIATAITDVSVFFGLTDITTLEEPFTNSADTVTSNASNGAGFLYDTAATTDQWWMVGVDGDTDATGIAALGVAPTADTYQDLRIEFEPDGESARFYVDDVLKGTLTAAVIAASTNLYLVACVCSTTTTSKTVTVDMLQIEHDRA